MNKPLLSICIPTYNRANYLKECLDSIVCQFDDKDVFNQIEVVISDNASEDNTKELVEEYQKKFSNIRYFRNKENLGFDLNVDIVLDKAEGSFCWTLSDDERLKKGALNFILEIIKQHPEIPYIGIERFKNDNKVQYFKNGNDIILKGELPPGGYLSFNIFNKKFIQFDKKKYYGNYWLHYSTLMELIVDKPFIMIKNILNNDLIRECSWVIEKRKGHCFTTYRCLKNIIQDLPQFGYDKKAVNKMLKGFARGLPKVIASAKIYGLKNSRENFTLLIKDFYYSPFWLFLSILIFLTPTIFFKQLKKIKIFFLKYYGVQ